MSNPKYNIIISDKAKDMLSNHMKYLSFKSISSARSTNKEIIRCIRSLEQFPERYPFLHSEYLPSNKYRKMFIKEYYLVLYQITGDQVYVDFILDCRHDYPWLI